MKHRLQLGLDDAGPRRRPATPTTRELLQQCNTVSKLDILGWTLVTIGAALGIVSLLSVIW